MKATLCFDREHMTHDELAQFLGQVVETMIHRDMQFLRRNRNCAPLYRAGVSYENSIGDWLDIPLTLAQGKGSCRELVPWRIAELRMAGTQAMVQVFVMDDTRLFHLQVVFPDNHVEDPSRILGMP